MTNPWITHLNAYKAQHQGKSLKECMVAASKTYKSSTPKKEKKVKCYTKKTKKGKTYVTCNDKKSKKDKAKDAAKTLMSIKEKETSKKY